MAEKKQTERFCPRCQVVKPVKDFYERYGERNQYLSLCKTCTDVIYEKAKDKHNIAAGIWAACVVNNIPFIKNVYDGVAPKIIEMGSKKGSRFGMYYKSLMDYGRIYEGVWESDASLSDYVKFNKNEEIVEEEQEPIDWEELYRVWGKFKDENGEPDEEAYEFLEDMFEQYTGEILEMDTAMKQTYRDLCIAHLQKRKADEGGDMAEVEKARKQINQNMALLKIDKFQTNTLSDEEKHIEYIAWEIENTEPAECEDLEKYKDFSGFERPFAEIMRCVKNLVAGTKEYPDITKDDTT